MDRPPHHVRNREELMTTKTDDQRCQNCRYFQSDDRSTQCHRYPPNTDDRWPYVGLFDWCGEWAAEVEEDEDHPPILLDPDSPEHDQFHYCPVEPDTRTPEEIDEWLLECIHDRIPEEAPAE